MSTIMRHKFSLFFHTIGHKSNQRNTVPVYFVKYSHKMMLHQSLLGTKSKSGNQGGDFDYFMSFCRTWLTFNMWC